MGKAQALLYKDHPRVGGEKGLDGVPTGSGLGSPPRGRGKGGLPCRPHLGRGITPAQAGKSKLALCTPSCPTDHPRACGEKNKELEGVWLPMGSPPHGRGKEASIFDDGQRLGITPAWAGKSRPRRFWAHRSQDHPRVGGEKRSASHLLVKYPGSPPHGRRKDDVFRGQILLPGITPAWAGKSPASQPWSPPLWIMVIRPRP